MKTPYELENTQFKNIADALKEEDYFFVASYDHYLTLSEEQQTSSDVFTEDNKKLSTYYADLYKNLHLSVFTSIKCLSEPPTLTLPEAGHLLTWFRQLFYSEIAGFAYLFDLPFSDFEINYANVFAFLDAYNLIEKFKKDELFFIPLLFSVFNRSDTFVKLFILSFLKSNLPQQSESRSQNYKIRLLQFALSAECEDILSLPFWNALFSLSQSPSAADWQVLIYFTPKNSSIEKEIIKLINEIAKKAIEESILSRLEQKQSEEEPNEINMLILFLTDLDCLITPEPDFLDQIVELADPLANIMNAFNLFLPQVISDRLDCVITSLINRKLEFDRTKDLPVVEFLRREKKQQKFSSIFPNHRKIRETPLSTASPTCAY